MKIRAVHTDDVANIVDIYNHYIVHSSATFELETVTPEILKERILSVQNSDCDWLVAEDQNNILGYAYFTPWKQRAAYKHSAEITVYISHAAQGKGVGTALYKELFKILAQKDIRAVVAQIALPNPTSIALHEKFGMKKVAHFEKVGFKFDEWIDLGCWQALL